MIIAPKFQFLNQSIIYYRTALHDNAQEWQYCCYRFYAWQNEEEKAVRSIK